MSTPHRDDHRAHQQVPRNRFRLIVISVVVLIILVIFGYMLLVGTNA
ncbi:hypothetical protein [Modestobacter altitudinis]|nr:hypothetical protein [Modestobacter altitudinis]